MSLNDPLPAPIANERRPICELVIEDIRERQEYGTRKYGTPLQVGNGRPPIIDVYQEALDLVIYLRQYIEEQKLGIGDVRAHEYENDRLRVENEQLQRNLLKWIEANNAATRLINEQWAEIERLRADAELAEEVIVEDDAELLRLRLECNDLRAENERLREALEAMNTKLEVESSFEEKGETYVAFYRIPAGPWHKILGLIRG